MYRFLRRLNIIAECEELRWAVWSCPPFLFLVMGIVTIIGLLATYAIAARFVDESGTIILVSAITGILLAIGNAVIHGFNKIAEANRMKGEFISIISHQLRSPLSVFKWTIDLMEHAPGHRTSPDRMADSLRTLRDTTENMIELVNMLLEVSRFEAGTLILRPEVFRLEELTRRMITGYERYARAAQINFSFAASSDLAPVCADIERTKIVIQNLIANAIHYSVGSGAVAVRISRADRFLRWEIRDSGVGIPRSERPMVFRKFFRGNNAAHRQTRGTGVGLYVAKGIIEASGGRIGFTSEEGVSTTFWFTVPLAAAEKGREQPGEDQ